MSTMNASIEESGPTFEQRITAILNTQRMDVTRSASELINEEMGHPLLATIYLLLTQKLYDKTSANLIDYHGKRHIESTGMGEIVLLTKGRLTLKPTEKFNKWFSEVPYLRHDLRHRTSVLAPVGCLGWVLFCTPRDGLITFDLHLSSSSICLPVFVKRGLLEPIRRCLKSRNEFNSHFLPNGHVGFKLTKSSLTMGQLDFLEEKYEEAIAERVKPYWENLMGKYSDLPKFNVVATGSRWDRKFEVFLDDNPKPLLTIKLLDKTFYAEF